MKQERHELQFPQYAQEYRGKLVDLRIGNRLETFAVDEKLYAELIDVEANPLGELSLLGMSDVRKKQAKQLAFMLMMHTKNRAIQMITKLSDPVNGFEIWRRFLEEWEPVNRGRYRAMLMQLLQCPLTESRGQALEEWERPVRQCEAQNLDTIKAATLAHKPQDSEWRKYVRLSATRLQRYDALNSVWKEKGKGKREGKEKGKLKGKEKGKRKGKENSKRKGKEKGKSKDKSKEGTFRHVEHEMLLLQGERIVPSP